MVWINNEKDMSMLKPLDTKKKPEPEYATDSPQRICEACGKSGPSHRMINCILVVGSPGWEGVPSFQCPQEEHWACSPDCWLKVAHACAEEHLHVILKDLHTTIREAKNATVPI